MADGARSWRPPQWLVIAVAVVFACGVMAVVHEYLDDDGSAAPGSSANGGSGDAGRALARTTFAGTSRSAEVSGQIRLPSLSIDTGPSVWFVGGTDLTGSGQLTIRGDMTIAVFRMVVAPGAQQFVPLSSIVDLPKDATVNGTPVPEGSNLSLGAGSSFLWLDAPATMTFDNVSEFSWAGSGEVVVGDQHLTGEYLGVYGDANVTLARGDAVQVTGDGSIQQAFVDGTPVLTTAATIDRLRTDISMHAGDSTDRTYITWAPRNAGRFAACILRIRPVSGHAEWVSVGLQTMPPMFGGEDHPKVGGDTSGMGDSGSFFGGADAIDSLINVGDADRRDLHLNVPADTPPGTYPIEFAIDGNFDPVVFAITVTVEG